MALAARGISIAEDPERPSRRANQNTPLGTLQGDQQQLTIVADTQLDNAAAFSKLIVKSADGKSVRLGDVTRVINSVANNQTASWY